MYNEFVEAKIHRKIRSTIYSVGFNSWQKPKRRIWDFWAQVQTDNRDIPIVKNVMKMTSSQIVIPDTIQTNKQQLVSNVKY